MSKLNKLSFKTVERKSISKGPVQKRRNKLTAAIEEQRLVLAAKLRGQDYTVDQRIYTTDQQGEPVAKTRQRRIRPWFFAQDNGWYVRCRYGTRRLLADGKNNAVFVKKLDEVGEVLDTFKEATQEGELDAAIAKATERKAKAKATQ